MRKLSAHLLPRKKGESKGVNLLKVRGALAFNKAVELDLPGSETLLLGSLMPRSEKLYALDYLSCVVVVGG